MMFASKNSLLTGFPIASAEAVKLRQTILQKCRLDLYHFFDHEKGQIAIYDAVNPLAEGRRQLAKEFAKHEIQTIFIESYVDDESIIEENVRSVKISSPDVSNKIHLSVKTYANSLCSMLVGTPTKRWRITSAG